MIEHLARLLTRHPEPSAPRAEWRRWFGQAGLASLERSGLLQRTALRDGDVYPCGEGADAGCQRHLHRRRDGGLVACCGCPWQAPDALIAADDGWLLTVPFSHLTAALSRVFELAPATSPAMLAPGMASLGSRSFGAERVGFYLRRRGAHTASDDVLLLNAPGVVVVLNLDPRAQCRADPAFDQGRLLEFDLGELITLNDAGLAPRWAPLVSALRPDMEQAGALLWPDIHLMIDISRRRIWLAGRRLDLPPGGQSEALLIALARRPLLLVNRYELIDLLWPEETARKRRNASHNLRDNDDKLRSAILQLRKALTPALAKAEGLLPADPMELVVAEREVDLNRSGYRLMMGGERVMIWE